MESSFVIKTIPRYEQMARKLIAGHFEFRGVQYRMREILSIDPYNQTRRYHIKKLAGVGLNEGQYRLSLGRWRFRYDIFDRQVVLQYCGLRREDTYR